MDSMTSILKKIYRSLPQPPTSFYKFREFGVDIYRMLPEKSVIFDIGSKQSRATYGFGPPPPDAKVVCVDMIEGPGVDLVADAHDMYMVADDSVDCVVTVSTLEHVYFPQRVIDEIYRILKPGGLVYVNVPFIFPFHSDPDDFYRFSDNGLKILCRKFECLENSFNRGPASTMHQLLIHFFAIFFSFNSRAIYNLNVDIFSWLLFWVKYIDSIIGRYSMAHILHTGAYFIGRKPIIRSSENTELPGV